SQTTGFRREGVDLIGALAHIAKQAFDGIGAANVAMHDLREGIKGQEMVLIFREATHSFWIALLVFGFEGRQVQESLLLLVLFPNPHQLGGDLLLLALGNGIATFAAPM